MGRSFVRQVLFLLGLAFLPAIGQALYYRGTVSWHQPPVDSATVSVAEAKSWGAAVLWVDARAEEPFAKAHVPGALRLDEDEWNTLLPGVLAAWSPERKVVVYCSRVTCNASHAVAERLRHEVQLKNVYVLEGGWEAWEK
ncbi:MAG: rhodanese-like domain-containing protein [Chthoniobacterales bacterium]